MNQQRNLTEFNIQMIEDELIRLATDLHEVTWRLEDNPNNSILTNYKLNTEARIKELSNELSECYEFLNK
jgi:hypothetical protein